MSGKSVLIIGAGLAGLATGCYAQMNGYRSQLLEHHAHPGGVAAAWRRGDYLIDGGIHFVMGHRPDSSLYSLYRELGIVPAVKFVDMPGYGMFVDEASGQRVEVSNDLDRLALDLKGLRSATSSPLSTSDTRIVDELAAGARAMHGLDLSSMGMSKPPELMGPLDQLKELWGMRRAFRYMVGRFGKPMTEYAGAVQSPVLRKFLEGLFVPESPVFFAAMLLALVADGQVGLIEGGCPEFVGAIEKRYRELGGQISYRATVGEILVEPDHGSGRKGDRAVGVRLIDGTEHRADAVVSAADGYSTVYKMLGGRYVDAKTTQRYATWKTFKPLVMVSYGVARDLSDEPHSVTYVLQEPLEIGGQAVDGMFVRHFAYSPRFAPPGRTVIQVRFESEWEVWERWQREDRPRYEAEKERVAAEVLRRLEAHYPGISAQVEVTDVATPYTTWRYTLNHRGSWGGWLMTADAMRTPIKRTLPGLASFYMAGQWITPGGGVPPCLYTGRHAVQLLCRDDGQPFATAVA